VGFVSSVLKYAQKISSVYKEVDKAVVGSNPTAGSLVNRRSIGFANSVLGHFLDTSTIPVRLEATAWNEILLHLRHRPAASSSLGEILHIRAHRA
jgi:hypothetical protein